MTVLFFQVSAIHRDNRLEVISYISVEQKQGRTKENLQFNDEQVDKKRCEAINQGKEIADKLFTTLDNDVVRVEISVICQSKQTIYKDDIYSYNRPYTEEYVIKNILPTLYALSIDNETYNLCGWYERDEGNEIVLELVAESSSYDEIPFQETFTISELVTKDVSYFQLQQM